jgi:hypothetical protein
VKSCTTLETDADQQETGLSVGLDLCYERPKKVAEPVMNLVKVGHSFHGDCEVEPACTVYDEPLDGDFIFIDRDQECSPGSALMNPSALKVAGKDDMRI